ncbi:DUF4952 domain-containing protein [Entomomonas asaccharolytica]|uniref:DUF4952 domain-containing protein n=1 Tax=Entomomonas asaccharolytica TaxID=2785331 RepID=A0A974ND91_9GAMM|nr:DUF4952 domain-containing protein [Entomomonas asaccharolytica]QQP84368.1 DUF4952 domain-containing protein [Entomomonas asaccharolytica]
MKLVSYSLLIIMALLVDCSHSSSHTKLPQSPCGDFLAMFNHKPKALVFQSCEVKYDRQAKPAIASYKVSGEQAAVIEQFLT